MNTTTPWVLPTPRALASRIAARLKLMVERLPMHPPALALLLALDPLLLPRLPADAREALSRRAVEIAVTDAAAARHVGGR